MFGPQGPPGGLGAGFAGMFNKQVLKGCGLVGGAERIVGGAEQIVGGAEWILGGAEWIVGGAERIVGGSERIVEGAEWICLIDDRMEGMNEKGQKTNRKENGKNFHGMKVLGAFSKYV